MRLKKFRIEKGLSQLGLARAAGVSQPAIYLIESGMVKRPRIETILRLARALGMDPADLVESGDGSGDR